MSLLGGCAACAAKDQTIELLRGELERRAAEAEKMQDRHAVEVERVQEKLLALTSPSTAGFLRAQEARIAEAMARSHAGAGQAAGPAMPPEIGHERMIVDGPDPGTVVDQQNGRTYVRIGESLVAATDAAAFGEMLDGMRDGKAPLVDELGRPVGTH